MSPAADQVAYWTGATAAALTGFTGFGRSLVDDADAAAGRSTLGLGTAATRNIGTSGTSVPLLDGVNSWSGTQTFSPAAAAAISVSGNRSLASWGAAGPNLRIVANTLTDTSTAGGGTVSVQGANSFGTPSLAATSSGVTITNGVTLYIAGPPAAGTNVTIANPWALYVNTGNVRIGGNLTYTGAGTFGTSVGDSHIFNGQATFVESAGAAITLKDSNSSGTAAAVEMSIIDQDNAVVARIGMESSANDDLYVHCRGGQCPADGGRCSPGDGHRRRHQSRLGQLVCDQRDAGSFRPLDRVVRGYRHGEEDGQRHLFGHSRSYLHSGDDTGVDGRSA